MAKTVQCNRRVVYGGVLIPSLTPFEVKDEDLQGILNLGGFEVIGSEETNQENGGQDDDNDDNQVDLDTVDFENLDKLSAKELIELGDALGLTLARNSSKVKAVEAIEAELIRLAEEQEDDEVETDADDEVAE